MKCKFEHDGVCYNIGAVQYKCKCKQPCDTIFPTTNADRIRAMSDEELADKLANLVRTFDLPDEVRDIWMSSNKISVRKAFYIWLQQPCGGADHA